MSLAKIWDTFWDPPIKDIQGWILSLHKDGGTSIINTDGTAQSQLTPGRWVTHLQRHRVSSQIRTNLRHHSRAPNGAFGQRPGESELREPPAMPSMSHLGAWELWSLALLSSLRSNSILFLLERRGHSSCQHIWSLLTSTPRRSTGDWWNIDRLLLFLNNCWII